MNGRMAKKIRREMRKEKQKVEEKIAIGMKDFINKLPIGKRLRIAYRILIKRW